MQLTNQSTFSTQYVATSYNITTTGIQKHLARHADELIENIHFFKTYEQTSGGRQEVVKWTLKGIVVLGFFIRSKEAKNFRIWASNQLERELLKQAQDYKEARARNLELTDKVAALEACTIKDAKDHQDQINGYKSQISQYNAVIASLKNELAEFKPKNGEPRYETLKTLLEHARKERDFYRKKSIKLENEKRDKELRTFRALQQTKEQLEHVYTAIGAVEAYVANDDRFFMEQNEILKG